MSICSRCGQESRADDRYCQFCGQELSQDLSALAQADSGPVRVVLSGDEVRWQEDAHAQYAAPREASAHAQGEPASANANTTGAPVATVVGRARLIVRSAAEGGAGDDRAEREFMLGERDVSVGRAPSCDIVLTGDQLASRRHALIRTKGRFYTVVDLGSSNGTYVNDLEIHEETVLHDGDSVKVGGHELLYFYSTGPVSRAAAHGAASYAPAAASSATPASPSGPASDPLPQVPLAETNPSMPLINLSTPAPAPAPMPPPPDAPPLAPAPQPQDAPREEAQPAPGVVERSNAPTANLQALREQLAQLTAVLAERADEAEHEANRLRGGLLEFRDQLAALLDGPQGNSTRGEDAELVALIRIARQAAQDRHLDQVSALADHADQIADALEANRPVGDGWLTRGTLGELRKRVDKLLEQDEV